MKISTKQLKFIAVATASVLLFGCANNTSNTNIPKSVEKIAPANAKYVKNFEQLAELAKTKQYEFTVYYDIHKDYTDKQIVAMKEGIATEANVDKIVKNVFIHKFISPAQVSKDSVIFSGDDDLGVGSQVSYLHTYSYNFKSSGDVIISGSDTANISKKFIQEKVGKYSLKGYLNKSVIVTYKKK